MPKPFVAKVAEQTHLLTRLSVLCSPFIVGSPKGWRTSHCGPKLGCSFLCVPARPLLGESGTRAASKNGVR